MNKKVDTSTADTLTTTDLLSVYKNNSQKILTIVIAVVAIVIVIVFYSNYTKSQNNEAWHAFSTFKQDTLNSPKVSSEDIQKIISEVDGSSAEPWVLYYCASLYFKNREFQNAVDLNNELQRDFKNHYICKNSLLFDKANLLSTNEIEWMNSHQN